MTVVARSLVGMSPTPSHPDLVRAEDAANEAIRAFMRLRAGRPLFGNERAEYERLLARWAAVRSQLAAAA